jgi:hypothetical protein
MHVLILYSFNQICKAETTELQMSHAANKMVIVLMILINPFMIYTV